MGIGELHCDCLAFVTFDLGDALFGRRLNRAMPSPRRRLTLTLTPDVDFGLDFVNARIRDGTQAPQS